MRASKAWIIVLAVASAASLGAAGILAINLSAAREEVRAAEQDARTAEDRADEAESELEDVSDELDAMETKLARARRNLNAALAEPEPEVDLATALANGTAEPDPDLSAESPARRFDCENNACSALSMEYVFRNESQKGSAVTCVIGIEYEGGGTTTFIWASRFVPPGGGTDTVRVFFYGDRPIDFISDPDDCYRGYATGP